MSGFDGSIATSFTPVFSLIGDGFPCLPAVGCFEETAVAARPPERSFRSDVDNLRIARIDHDPADMLRLLQAEILPVLPAIIRAVNPIAIATLRCELVSPAPTHTTDGSFGSSSTQPIEYEPTLSNSGVHVVPSLTVFQTPPEATPT